MKTLHTIYNNFAKHNVARLLTIFTLLLTVGIGNAWAEDVIYKSTIFSSDNQPNNSSYTSTFINTTDGFAVTVGNANNNNNSWSGYIKMGRKNYTSIGYITTQSVIDKKITKVTLKIEAITATKINSIKLYKSSNGSSWTELGSFDKSTGEKEVSVTSENQAINQYYKIEVNCASGSSNGLITLSRVDYYTEAAASTPTELLAPTGLTALDITSSSATLSWDAVANASSYSVYITDIDSYEKTISNITPTSTTVNDLTPETSYLWTVKAIGNGTSYTDSEESEIGEFTTAAAGGGGGEGDCTWEETDISAISSTDIVIITMTNSDGTTYAMSNNNGASSAPSAVNVTITDGKLSTEENIKWNVGGTTNAYVFYPEGSDNNLYCTNANNGVRVGTSTENTFKIDTESGYLVHNGTSRYIGVYNSQDWRCYTSIHANIANQTLKFYKQVCPVVEYTVTYKANGGTGNDVETTTSKVADCTFARNGYNFTGWNTEADGSGDSYDVDSEVTSDLILYAQWEIINYTITYYLNDGTNNNANPETYTIETETITLQDPSRNGYTFGGWYEQSDFSGSAVTEITKGSTGHKTLYAQWTAIKYTIKYQDTKEATNSNPGTYTIEDEITFANLTDLPKGYNFTGWDPASIAKGTTGNQTVTAQWTEKALTNYRTACDIKCVGAYSFHTGTGTDDDVKNTENITCFTEYGVEQGTLEHEWQIRDYTIPADDKFFVGYLGYFYNDNLGVGNQDGDKSHSVISDWNAMYHVPSMDEDDTNHSPRMGLATGAVGTLRIFDNSNWDNLFVGFIPEGYKLKFGDNEYALTLFDSENHDYRTELLQYVPTNYANAVSVGVIDENGNYVATANTQEMRHIFLKVPSNSNWAKDNAKFSVYDIGASAFKNGFMTLVSGSTELYEGWVDKDCANIIFVRHNATADYPSWDNKWNQTGDLSLQAEQNMFTITADTGDGLGNAGWVNGTYTKYGKFRMYEDSKAINWYVNFYPYHALTYDKNAEDAIGTMDMQFIEADAADKKVVVANCGFTRPGYEFESWRKGETSTYFVAGVNHELVADVTFYAKWKAKKITITWEANGGSVTPPTSTYTYNGTPVELPTPTRANYIFNGWFTAATDGTKITEVGTNNKPTEDVTYYAQWTEKATPTFAWSDATCTAALEADNTFPTLNNPNPLPVTYTSSNTDVATIDANGNITLVATGPTTITANGAETATHKSATDSYTLTVVESNCRWVEVTDNTTLEDGDEVVITMGKSGITYALPNAKRVTSDPAPSAIDVTTNIVGNEMTSVANNIKWTIERVDDFYVFYTISNEGRYNLYCNSGDNGVCVAGSGNALTNHKFSIDGNYLKSQTQLSYLAISFSTSSWRSISDNTTPTYSGQTLKFYKRECLDATNYWVTWDAGDGQWTDGASKKIEDYTVGETIVVPTEKPTREGYRFDGWSPTPGTMLAQNTTFTAQWTQIHTIKWLVGGAPVHTEEVLNNKAITETPGDDPLGTAIGDCADTFVGWSESNLGSAEGQSAPPDLCTAAQMKSKHTSVTGDKTFFAVFASVSGSGVPTAYTAGDVGNFVLAAKNGSKWYALPANPTVNSGKIQGVEITVTTTSGVDHVTTANASGYTWTIANATNGQTISDGSKYIYHSNGGADGTNLTYGNSTSFTWKIEKESAGLTFKAMNGATTNSRGMLMNGTKFGGYSLTNEGASDYYRISVLPISDGVSYSNYVTNCCELLPVTNLQVSGVTENSATLTWTKPSSTTGITELQIRNTNDDVIVDDINPTTTTATINGLDECKKYNYYVVSVGAECEVSSETITAQPFSGAKTVNYDYNGGTGSPASFTTSCENQKIILPIATRPGYTFNGWFDAASGGNLVGVAGAEYNPTTSPITLYAHWTETIYQLTHSGSNYTNTENKTSIKSSDTPFTLHYTCTGDYGLPATISITGGGKSWTVNTDYTWEVAADKQSATLVIKETVISADVTITINVATRYTVTFVHNDKGVFTGSETIEVLSSENTITLPTVTDVSCGFYDTFEGWIVADEDYTESTSKPAGTIYKGGANYTVNSDCTLRALYSKCEGDNKEVYVKVIENLDDWSGTYLIVNETNNVVMDGSKTTETGLIAQNNCQNITINNNQIESNNQNDTYTFTIAPHTTTSGKYSIKSYSGYYIGSNSASNTINATTTESTYSNSITITDDILTIGCGKYKDSDASKEYRLMYMHSGSGAPVFKYYPNTQGQVCLYKKGTLCTKYYSTNPSCEKPVGVHIVYNANAADASMSCNTQDRTYKVENEVNKYPQLASQLQFCTNATREGYTLVGWNTQANGQGTTYNINQNYYNLPVSGELDGDKWITLNLYAMWKPCIKFNLGNAIGGTGVPDVVVENGECVLPEPTAEQLGTIPCGYEFYAWSETSVNATQTKPALFMPGDTYTGSALTLYAVYRWCEGNTGSDTYYFTFIVDGQTYCITQKHSNYACFVVEEATSGLIFGIENDYLYYLDENGVKNYVYYEGSSTTVITTTTYPNSEQCKTTFVDAGDGTTIVEPAINNGNRTLQFTGTGNISDYYDRAYYTTGGTNPTLVEVQSSTCTYATNPTCYTNTNLHFVTNGGTLNYPTDYDETNYQELAIGDDILLPTATFAGEWTFEGWKRGSQLESQTIKPYDPSFYPVTPNSTLFEVDELGDIYFYAVYSKTNDDKQFDPVSGGTYKLYAIGADGTKTYMPIWTGSRGTPSGVTTCAESGDYTITPGAGTHAGQYQITCGEYTLGVVSGNTDLNEVEGTWWNIEPSTSGKGTWRITVVGSTDDRALICSFSTAKSFGNYAISNLNGSAQTVYRDMEIGECIYTEYTSTPENIPYITITGAPVKITSTNGERVYAPTTLHIEAHNFTGERIIHLSATNGFGVDPVQVRTNGQGAYSGDVKVYYEPTTDGDGQTITTSRFTASQTGGTNDEKISQTFTAIQGRNMPANFVIAAKWDGLWYALPANCTTSNSSTEGLLIEVDDVDNPTKATSAPASAKYGIREVIPSRQTNNGKAIVFTERFAEGDKQFALYNGSNANIQVNAQYTNYAQTNPDQYEWIPSTSDFKDYTLTNASTGRNLGLTSGTFGAYTAASNQVRLLPATFYEPATAQVLKWKANSVIVMYTGPEATATTQIGNNAASDKQTLADQKITHGIYELTTKQALTSNAGGALKLNFGENTRVELEIPLIISGEVTASANAHDVVILENSKLTAAATKYSYKDVYVYGGAKLAIPDGTELGVNNIILRAGGVATNGAGKEATYQYIYPQVELKGTLTSSVKNIRYEYVTDYDHWYHLVLPFDGSLASIHYPYEYYGDQVKLDNNGSWIIKRYDGATRATGNYDAWKDIEKDEPKATTVTAGKGYIYWGAPKKITANGEYARPTWGIQRITMSVSAPDAKTAENGNKTISGLGSYENVPNNSGKDNDQGWNLIGNPYMVNIATMSDAGLKAGKLEEEKVDDKWTGKWINNGDNLRYLTIPSEHFDTYEAKTVSEAISANALVPGRAFFVQLDGEANGITFAAANRASLMPALRAANDKPVDIETGIVLSNETLQDEVNFWIKDGKTNDYEYNADYPKTPNNNQFNIYGVHTNGDLSWVAISPEIAAESMPIGYQVPAAGTYMLSVSEEYYSDEIDALLVTDHEMSPEVTTDLMITSYEFSVNQAETNNKRFTVAIKLKNGDNNDATGLDNLGIGNEHLMKFIYQDKIYILHHGVIYDATGKRVITINK